MRRVFCRRYRQLALLISVATALIGCQSGDTLPPANAVPSFETAPRTQVVIRNTLDPNRVSVVFTVDDPDGDTLTATATSSDQIVVSDEALTPSCSQGRCELTFVPNAAATASTTVTLRVSDPRGAQVSRSFLVEVVPRLVRTLNDSGTGSLRQAIREADPGDVIGFDTESTFSTAKTITLTSGSLLIKKPLTFEGPGRDRLTVSASGKSRLLELSGEAEVRLNALSLTQGEAPETCGPLEGFACGGGVFLGTGTSLTLFDVRVSGNNAELGGGLYNDGGTLIIEGSTISDNSARKSGGIFNLGTLKLIGSTVRGNQAFFGGGIYNQGTAHLINSFVSDNPAELGGGLYNIYGSLTFEHSTVSGNEAGEGGGVYNLYGELTFRNSLIAGQAKGGDCFNFEGMLVSQGYNLDNDGSCNLTQETDISASDPMLATWQEVGGANASMVLLPGSPAIDAGTCSLASGQTIGFDQRRVVRPQDGDGDALARCDIGAFEFAPEPPAVRLELILAEGQRCLGDGSTPFALALLGTVEFDVTVLDPTTIAFVGFASEALGPAVSTATEDVNADGTSDLLIHFDADGFPLSDSTVTVTASTADGLPVEGMMSACLGEKMPLR
ncbi:MAG: right-handed parallel beta-helix repeat-containing protein [Trueperaceae bacterium]|nr:MAG: right-handed parallel beta-helix repeat-containing protein [Trueperaceae bacterium]